MTKAPRYGLKSLVVPAGDGKVVVTRDDIDKMGLTTPTAQDNQEVQVSKVDQDRCDHHLQ